jgi:hypothetical protein
MKAIRIPLAGKYLFKIVGFPVPEVKNFTVEPHDTAGLDDVLMGSGVYEEFGSGTGTVDLAIPQADLIPWEQFNGQIPFGAVVASLEPASGVGPCWDIEGFVVTNPGGPRQSDKGPATRALKIGFIALTPRKI